MTIPDSEVARVMQLLERWHKHGFCPMGDEKELLMRVAGADPTAITPAVTMLVSHLNAGRIAPGDEIGAINFLNDFAALSEHLRIEIASSINTSLLEFYTNESAGDGLRNAAERLSETLRVERPKHYFDFARNILASNGSIFIVGAGFSYDAYVPLLREMEGVACSTLYDLGVADPQDLYHRDDMAAWERIAEGWKTFQHHVSYTLSPKEPAKQHFIIAELFKLGHVTHIVSFNWDDLIEKAYRQMYNKEIPKIVEEDTTSDHALWKCHGDILNPDKRWVLPHDEGRVPPALEEISVTLSVPTIVIGYREQEHLVSKKLIEVLEKRGGVTRIRPDLPNNPPYSFADNSLMCMKKIKAGIESAKNSSYPT